MSDLYLVGLCIGASLVATLPGFYRTVWFISIGYTLAISLCAVLIAIMAPVLEWHSVAQLAILFIWAVRLGYFLVLRERNANYTNAVADQTDRSQALPLVAKMGIWLSTSVLYACMLSPAVFALGPASTLGGIALGVVLTGIVVMLAGVLIESIADQQKSDFKRNHPGRFTNVGLFRWVRCPNYLGEILVWLGSFLVGMAFFDQWWHWLLAAVGLVCIVLIMIGSTKRLERKQKKRYGENAEFLAYCRTVPVLFPWVPVYTLKNIRVYLE